MHENFIHGLNTYYIQYQMGESTYDDEMAVPNCMTTLYTILLPDGKMSIRRFIDTSIHRTPKRKVNIALLGITYSLALLYT